ncbi:MAG: prepilin-type N-terminal cleavage/methylation domain-containing protein [Candidatus Taylorbacteria bacterium]|nr:prepilin-type N-terminal cleavage/methylation domain-containing protein [Candidatus Taylorbacteria bacterium]
MKTNKRGFTLVELLIVLAIIGIFTSVVIGATNASRGKARDTKRISDMKEIELGLALYFDVNKVYPASLNTLVTEKYLPSLPGDPLGTAYEYLPANSNKNYCIGVKLEAGIPNDSATCTSASSGSLANYKSQR